MRAAIDPAIRAPFVREVAEHYRPVYGSWSAAQADHAERVVAKALDDVDVYLVTNKSSKVVEWVLRPHGRFQTP